MPSATDEYLELAAHIFGIAWDGEDDDQRERVEMELFLRFGLDVDGFEAVASALLRCTMPCREPLSGSPMHLFGRMETRGLYFRAIVKERADAFADVAEV